MDPQAQASNDTDGRHPGEVIAGKYLLLAPLGAGGMGQVWTAENLATGAEVAVKLLHASRARSGDLLARFRQEAHATAQLMHRGIIRVFDLIEQATPDGSLAIVMERLRGRTLAERLHSQGPLSVDETLDVILPLLGALQYAHGLGIIHRDLKPENVFLAIEPDGEVIPKLLDFGISKMVRRDSPPITLTGLILGTPSYMSPEQLRAEAVDARSDIFSVGILLYECLTGRNPFEAPSGSVSRMTAALEVEPVRPPEISEPLWGVISRALARPVDARFSSAGELAEALLRCARPVPPEASGAMPLAPPRTPVEGGVALPPHATSWVPAPILARPWAWAGLMAFASFVALVVWTSPANSAVRTHLVRQVAARSVQVEPRHLTRTVDRIAPADVASPPPSERTTIAPNAPVETGRFLVSSSASAPRIHASKARLVLRDPGF